LQITTYPHPYNSHANDLVRQYILERLYNITRNYPEANIQISNDLQSNGSWAQGIATYFEGTNILVKINSTETSDSANANTTNEDAILFSAHYDSVSTAPGAIDDGMGVVTLLGLVEYFATKEHRPKKRSAVFNFNNGEEDWLNGAHAYVILNRSFQIPAASMVESDKDFHKP
jgi:Zn-dependent M28 family amino/carboxypeptidase